MHCCLPGIGLILSCRNCGRLDIKVSSFSLCRRRGSGTKAPAPPWHWMVSTQRMTTRGTRVYHTLEGVLPDRFEDERGVIQDLLGPVDAVTEIYTRKGCIRGNHIHQQTTQWTYVVSGEILFARLEDDGMHDRICTPGELVTEPAGI